MSTIVVTTFELADGVTAEAFTEADASYQQDVAYQQPGLLRRTTSRELGSSTSWCIVESWVDAAQVVAWHTDELESMVTNVQRRVFDTLE